MIPKSFTSGSMTRVTANQIFIQVSKHPERALQDTEVLEVLEGFKGAPDADQVQEAIQKKITKLSDIAGRRLGNLSFRITDLENKRQELDRHCRTISEQLEAANKGFAMKCCDFEDEPSLNEVYEANMRLAKVEVGRRRLEIELEETQKRSKHLARLRLAMQSVVQYLKEPRIYVATVKLDISSGQETATCINMSGEQIIQFQGADITIGKLLQAMSKTIPDMYVQLVSLDGILLDGADDDHLKVILGPK